MTITITGYDIFGILLTLVTAALAFAAFSIFKSEGAKHAWVAFLISALMVTATAHFFLQH